MTFDQDSIVVSCCFFTVINTTPERCLSPQLASNDTNGLLRTISSGFWHSNVVNDRHATSAKLGAEPLVSYVIGFRSGKWEPISATSPFSICCLNKQWPPRCLLCLLFCPFSSPKETVYFFKGCWSRILSQTHQEVLFVFNKRNLR